MKIKAECLGSQCPSLGRIMGFELLGPQAREYCADFGEQALESLESDTSVTLRDARQKIGCPVPEYVADILRSNASLCAEDLVRGSAQDAVDRLNTEAGTDFYRLNDIYNPDLDERIDFNRH